MKEPRRNFWLDRPVLLTGATGLIGGWLLKRLESEGANVVCLVRDWVPKSEAARAGLFEKSTVVRGDVRDQELLERVLGEYEVESVFHLAAQTIVPIANRNPGSTFDSNVRGTWTVLEAARRSPRVGQVVLASSDKAYGETNHLPYTEETPLKAQHPYDVSKAAGDLIAQSFASTYGVPVAITRCGNVFGGGDLNWNRIVPGTIRSVLRKQRPTVRSDGGHRRDYFYVEDAVLAYTLMAERLSARPRLRGHAFNFSNEEPKTVLELVYRILGLMKTKAKPVIRNEATHEVRDQFLDSAKARKVLGWRARFTLDEGLLRTIQWYKRELSL